MNKLVIFNAESAYFFLTDNIFRDSIKGASRLFCDSMSLSFILKICRISHKRLHGPDFMDHYLKLFYKDKIMIIGGNKKAHDNIKNKYKICNGFYIDSAVKEENLSEILNYIEKFSPKIIFVCLGLRKQESVTNYVWNNYKNNKKFNETIIIGIGAAVDFIGETKKRSGIFWRKLGLEWFPRVIREPRMIPRIIRSFKGCILLLFKSHLLSRDNLHFAEKF